MNGSAVGRKYMPDISGDALNEGTVLWWFNKFKDGDKSFQDSQCTERPQVINYEPPQATFHVSTEFSHPYCKNYFMYHSDSFTHMEMRLVLGHRETISACYETICVLLKRTINNLLN